MKLFVNASAILDGDGTKEKPFKKIGQAAAVAKPGDEVLVAPGVYREYVNPINAGTEENRIVYKSVEPLAAVITGAEELKGWTRYNGNVWTASVDNSMFGNFNPFKSLLLFNLAIIISIQPSLVCQINCKSSKRCSNHYCYHRNH